MILLSSFGLLDPKTDSDLSTRGLFGKWRKHRKEWAGQKTANKECVMPKNHHKGCEHLMSLGSSQRTHASTCPPEGPEKRPCSNSHRSTIKDAAEMWLPNFQPTSRVGNVGICSQREALGKNMHCRPLVCTLHSKGYWTWAMESSVHKGWSTC